jgi:serine/threonine protein phosphatase PrpC
LNPTEPVPFTPKGVFVQEVDFAARQYRGKRENQEDYYAFADAAESSEEPLSKLLLVLGDGLGAHSGGSVASYIAVGAFVKSYHENDLAPSWRMRVALERANDTIGLVSNRLPHDGSPMGTTLLAVLACKNTLQWISVGDSPLFLYREGVLHRINQDHSLSPILEARVAAGELTEEDALHHPDRHTLQSAVIGGNIALVDNATEPTLLQKGDIIIGASDGIFTLSNRQLEELLAFGQHTTADKIADAIIFAIRRINFERQDNTTIAVIKA